METESQSSSLRKRRWWLLAALMIIICAIPPAVWLAWQLPYPLYEITQRDVVLTSSGITFLLAGNSHDSLETIEAWYIKRGFENGTLLGDPYLLRLQRIPKALYLQNFVVLVTTSSNETSIITRIRISTNPPFLAPSE